MKNGYNNYIIKAKVNEIVQKEEYQNAVSVFF